MTNPQSQCHVLVLFIIPAVLHFPPARLTLMSITDTNRGLLLPLAPDWTAVPVCLSLKPFMRLVFCQIHYLIPSML